MRIAILGSTGQIGQLILKQLRSDYSTAEIIACSRSLIPGHFQFDPFTDDWSKLGKVNVLINSVGIITENKSNTFEKIHIGLTELILTNRKKLNDPRIIQISVNGAVENSDSRFQSTKAKADKKLIKEKNTIVIRPSIVCTPDTMIVRKFRMLRRISRFTAGFIPLPSHIIRTKIQPILGKNLAKIISMLCVNTTTGNIEAGGPEEILLGDLLKTYLGLKIISMNQNMADVLLPMVIKIFPSLINKDQYILLRKDNVASKNIAEELLNGDLISTKAFWYNEFN